MKIFKTFLILLLLISCNKNKSELEPVTVHINFSHHWDNMSITKSDFNTIKFTNAVGNQLSIERLRYLISNIELTTGNQVLQLKPYHLIDLENEQSLHLLSNTKIPVGEYNLSFTFGFTDADNKDGVYQDLNTVNFNVPSMLGGGYHFMQFDGKYQGATSINNFNYHVIRAVDRSNPSNVVFQDTSFKVELGSVLVQEGSAIKVKMNVSEWFKNPHNWDLNVLNTVLMPNFNAQVLMNANGKNVFSL
jgi:hypothetical protein